MQALEGRFETHLQRGSVQVQRRAKQLLQRSLRTDSLYYYQPYQVADTLLTQYVSWRHRRPPLPKQHIPTTL